MEGRRPKDDEELRLWLESMIWHHHYSDEEIGAAFGMGLEEVMRVRSRYPYTVNNRPQRPAGSPLLVWLDRMDITGGKITLSGRGLNPNAIALFVENVKNDPYFEEPQLGTMAQVSTAPIVYSFDMNFGFTYVPKGTAPATTDTAAGTTTQ